MSGNMIVITSGKKYLDIDGYASSIAYRELLKLKGIESKFVSNGTLNGSITPSLLKLPYKVDDYKVKEEDKFIILDTSNKEFFEDFVNIDNIIEIIDHHPGYEEYWNNIHNLKSQIEPIGSVATIIVEKYIEFNLLEKMDKNIAKLLMSAILDNTLNFTANITKDRDKLAYKKLEKIVGIKNYDFEYFIECEKQIIDNLNDSIRNDIKIEYISDILPRVLGQLLIYDINNILKYKNNIIDIMNSYDDNWLINIITLKDNKSYILASNDLVKNNLERLFAKKINDEFLIIEPNILRKEIMKKAYNFKEE